MQVKEWMKSPVHTVKPLDTAAHARQVLMKHRVNQVPVVARDQLVGVVTDRDLRDVFPSVFEAASRRAKGQDFLSSPENVPVEEILSGEVFSVGPEDTVEDAARILRRERIGGLPVVSGRRLVGILTRSDVLEAFIALVERLREGRHVEPTSPPAHASDEVKTNW